MMIGLSSFRFIQEKPIIFAQLLDGSYRIQSFICSYLACDLLFLRMVPILFFISFSILKLLLILYSIPVISVTSSYLTIGQFLNRIFFFSGTLFIIATLIVSLSLLVRIFYYNFSLPI